MQIDRAGQAALLKLAEIDLELNQIKNQMQQLIASAELKELQANMMAATESLLQARTELENLQTSVKRAEEDIRLVNERLVRDRERLNSTSSSKDAVGMQSEIESLTKRKDDLETVEIGLLEELDSAQQKFDASSEAKALVQEQLAQLQGKIELELEQLKSRGRKLTADRVIVFEKIPAVVLKQYDNLANKQVAVGQIVDKTCSACRMVIPATALAKLVALVEDEIGNCPECQALIVR